MGPGPGPSPAPFFVFLLVFVCGRARLVVLRRQETHSEEGDSANIATMNIKDNPTFIFDDYDIIPGHYLDIKKPSKYLTARRGSLG